MAHAPWLWMLLYAFVPATIADPPSFGEGSTGESVAHSERPDTQSQADGL